MRGDDVVLMPDVTDEEASRDFKGFDTVSVPSKMKYLRKINLERM